MCPGLWSRISGFVTQYLDLAPSKILVGLFSDQKTTNLTVFRLINLYIRHRHIRSDIRILLMLTRQLVMKNSGVFDDYVING